MTATTQRRPPRRVPPYRDPIALWRDDNGPRHDDVPSQARPPSQPERPRPSERRCRLTLELPGGTYTVRPQVCDPPREGIGGVPGRFVDFKSDDGQVVARIWTYPDGLRCSCNPEDEEECEHVAAAVAAWLFPEVFLLLDEPGAAGVAP